VVERGATAVGPRVATTVVSQTATITITAETVVAGSTAAVATEVAVGETVTEAEIRREEFLIPDTFKPEPSSSPASQVGAAYSIDRQTRNGGSG
jgi:hypothetical protein